MHVYAKVLIIRELLIILFVSKINVYLLPDLLYFNSLVQVIQEAVPMAAHGSPDTSTIQNTILE